MDGLDFDALTRSLAGAGSRRRALASLLLGALGVLGVRAEETAAKNCKKIKDKKKRKKCLKKTKSASPSSPPGPTCSDGVRNGAETDIDCGGGTCPRCINGKACLTRNDCAGARCIDTVCVECTSHDTCLPDANGPCSCEVLAEQPPGTLKRACVNDSQPHPAVANCSLCPPGTTCVQSAAGAECPKPCGAP
jgi:hypothetical protein